ncbi:TPA: hypothetical protein ENS27_07270, partial [bacterium]|nr:hypothetical protein [bacterium]
MTTTSGPGVAETKSLTLFPPDGETVMLLAEEEELNDSHFSFLIENKAVFEAEEDKFILQIPQKGIKIDVVLKALIL